MFPCTSLGVFCKHSSSVQKTLPATQREHKLHSLQMGNPVFEKFWQLRLQTVKFQFQIVLFEAYFVYYSYYLNLDMSTLANNQNLNTKTKTNEKVFLFCIVPQLEAQTLTIQTALTQKGK